MDDYSTLYRDILIRVRLASILQCDPSDFHLFTVSDTRSHTPSAGGVATAPFTDSTKVELV